MYVLVCVKTLCIKHNLEFAIKLNPFNLVLSAPRD